jgi:cytoskeletal protein CcmA (bactofilin family)
MARKSHEDALGVAGAETVIGTGVVVVGNLSSESDITVDGTLDGAIKAGGNVVIGVNAVVKGNVEATNVAISGSLHGDVTASGEATIGETGHLKGNVRATSLAISSGAVFIGRSVMEAAPRLGHDHHAQEQSEPTDKDVEA